MNKTDIWVYADFDGYPEPQIVGLLSAQQAKGRKAFAFTFEPEFLESFPNLVLDPELGFFHGPQYPADKEMFGMFSDAMPDRWGRMLIKRRFVSLSTKTPNLTLQEPDFLVGIQDETRMGALRFKLDPEGPFVSQFGTAPVPPITSIRELQQAALGLEKDESEEDAQNWLSILIAPGSSLGGARPKANVKDPEGNLWIAKFPSQSDYDDKGAWEYVLYQLAIKAGINMAPSSIMQVQGPYHTFLTKRFDRAGKKRIHFASAMTMTGYHESSLRDQQASYLEIAEFIRFNGAAPSMDLQQLWRRILFNVLVSNTDDHLRNHGFLLKKDGWHLSPAYDLNPNPDGIGLSLAIDLEHNECNLDLVMEVGEFFDLDLKQMHLIREEVVNAVRLWMEVAHQTGITRPGISRMTPAFRLTN